MGFFGELKKLTQPYEDENDFYEGADEAFKAPTVISEAQKAFESTFSAAQPDAPAPAAADTQESEQDEDYGFRFGRSSEGGFLGALTGKKSAARTKTVRERTVNFGGMDQQVVLFNPKTFQEAQDLMTHMKNCRSVVMTLERVEDDKARRLLDFMSGIAVAMDCKITPISARTFFVAPKDVSFIGDQPAASDLE